MFVKFIKIFTVLLSALSWTRGELCSRYFSLRHSVIESIDFGNAANPCRKIVVNSWDTVIKKDVFKNFGGTRITALDFSGEIEVIEDGAFHYFEDLEIFELSYYKNNSAKNLLFFEGHGKLEQICVRGNRWLDSMLDTSNFTLKVSHYYPNLRVLSLTYLGPLKVSTVNWTSLMPKLRKLDLSRNIGMDPKFLTERLPPSIENLHLRHNAFNSINVTGLQGLTDLSAGQNNFRSLRFTDNPDTCKSDGQICIGLLSKLEVLDISDCQISEFTIQYSVKNAVPELRYLDLSRNKFKSIADISPVSLNQPTFSIPIISRSDIDCVSTAEKPCPLFPKLRTLWARGQEPKYSQISIPTGNWRALVPKLKVLNLSRNQGIDLQYLLEHLPPSVEVLHSRQNALTAMKITGLPNLTDLSVGENHFTSLRFTDNADTCKAENQICIGVMDRLQSLAVNDCQLSEFTIQYFTRNALPELRRLFVTGNKFKTVTDASTIPSILPKFQLLTTLWIDVDALISIETPCGWFPNLQTLWVSGEEPKNFSVRLKEHSCLTKVQVNFSPEQDTGVRLIGALF